VRAATERAAEASRNLPNADKLGALLHNTMRDTPTYRLSQAPLHS